MNIIWHYLDKRGAAINALKDYGSMQYIIDHTDEEIDTTSTLSGLPHTTKRTVRFSIWPCFCMASDE